MEKEKMFNKEISLGHLLTIGAMLIGGFASYHGLMENVRVMEHRLSQVEKRIDNKKPTDMELSNFIVRTDSRLLSLESLNKTQDARLNVMDVKIEKGLQNKRR